MKSKLLLLVTVLCISLSCLLQNKASANHAAGGEIIYIHLRDSAYQFILKFYRDCTGPQAPANFDLCVYNTCTNTSFTLPMNKWGGTLPPDNRPNGSPVSPGCSGSPTKCQNAASNVPGYEEWWYECTIPALPLQCNYWKFGCVVGTTSLCCRNTSTNLVGTPNFYIESTFNSTVQSTGKTPWDNSSPYYSVKPIPYVCLNTPFSYNNGAIDRDGDSLSSQMINPLNAANCTGTPSLAPLQTLTPPINFTTNPFQTNNTFNLNNGNGQMTFTATQQGAGTLTIKTREFRKDIVTNTMREIGSIMRDVQVQVLACSTIVPKLDTTYINDSGRFLNGKTYGCIGQTLEFCFEVTSTDTDAVLIVEDNLLSALPNATITYTTLGTDTVKGCFKWTPTANEVGAHSFIIMIKDSTCDPPGILFTYVHNVDLYIWGPTKATPDTSICSGEPAFLGVSGGGDYVWTVLNGTNPSLNNPNIPNPVAQPKVTTTYLVTSTINSFCPSYNKDTVVINVIPGPVMAGQPDDTTCPNHPLQMNLGILKDPGTVYNVTWTPAAGLNNNTIDNPTATLKTATTYYVEVRSNTNRCKTLDTVLVDVLTGLSIENPDTQICIGQSVDVRGAGDPRYLYEWKAPTDPGVIHTSAGAILNTITPGDTGNHTYKLKASYFKCIGKDTTAEFDIDVQPYPVVSVDDDATICYGDTMQMNGVVSPVTFNRYIYSWTPGAALDFPDRKNPIFSAVSEGITTLKFVTKTPAGCSDSDEVVLNVYPAEFLYVPKDTAICPGDTISLDMITESGTKFYWLPDYNISSVSSQQPRIWPVTEQLYTVYGVDKFGCLDTNDVMITVRPRAVIDMPDSITLYPGESYLMDPGGNCLYYTWFPPLGLNNADVSNPSVSPKVNTRYIVHGRTESGCIATDSINILVVNEAIINIPNAFTPGKTGNGTLKIVRRGMADLKSFAVYNRWGTKVFETSDINEGWDGTFNGEIQPVGVYVYTIEAVTYSGQTIKKQGNVTLLK